MKVRQLMVVGAGIMGTGIAHRLALHGYDVVLTDTSDKAANRALETIRCGPWGLDAAVERGLIDAETADAAHARIRAESDLGAACADADIVVEAVYEDLAIKIRLFRQLDELCPERTILASNTSGFPIDALAAATQRPQKVIGWHFASPVPVMQLSEIVVHPETDDDTRDTVVAVATSMGTHPEVVRDDPFHWGFVTSRILFALFREADAIVADRVATAEQVDILVKDCFRWPLGPFEMRSGIEKSHYFAGADPDNPPATLSAAYHDAARARRGSKEF